MEAKIEGAQQAINYRFRNTTILWEALSAPGGVCIPGTPNLRDGNRRLALLGDSILRTILVRTWYASGQDRGQGSQIICTVGSNGNLNTVGRTRGLHAFVNTNPSQYGVVTPSTMATTVEAIIGAAYLDGGFHAAVSVMQSLGLTAVDEDTPPLWKFSGNKLAEPLRDFGCGEFPV